MFPFARTLVLGALLAFAGGCQGVPPKPPAISKGDYHAVVSYLSKRISHDLSALDVPGLSIALVDDQKLVWSAGFGYADEARHRSASSDTLYRVGAISKLVTAAGVMRAADDGRLALDMPAAQALPQWEIQPRRAAMQWLGAHPVTARSLLTLRPDTPRTPWAGRVPTWAMPCWATWWRTRPKSPSIPICAARSCAR